MDWNLNYGELAKDKDFVNNCENLVEHLQEVQKVLDKVLPLKAHYDKMSLPAKIEYDLFLVYALNALLWIYLRIQDVDLTNHPIKDELKRIKMTMLRWQQVRDRQKRPTVNVQAARRFVRSGLYDPNTTSQPPQNKKIRFTDNDE